MRTETSRVRFSQKMGHDGTSSEILTETDGTSSEILTETDGTSECDSHRN